jgi:hypothetical protein
MTKAGWIGVPTPFLYDVDPLPHILAFDDPFVM